MTVKQLIDLLVAMPQNAKVVLSRDSEGNGYSPVASYSRGRYAPENTYSGDFSTYGEDENGDEVDLPPSKMNAICLWPTN